MSYHHQLSPVQIPDVIPASLPSYGLFSMAAGDFLEVYTEKGLKQHYYVSKQNGIQPTMLVTKAVMLWVQASVSRHHTNL